MQLDRYVDDLRTQLAAAADAGGDDVRAVAERLSTALEPATRLVLLELLSEVAGEVTRELAPTSVDVRLRGRDPELVVSQVTPPSATRDPGPVSQPPHEAPEDTYRTTVRLPDHLKTRLERAAHADGVSVNTWLVRAVAGALDAHADHARSPARTASGATSFTGWVR